jgi:selenocysteine lyase/cysteine desulfurase
MRTPRRDDFLLPDEEVYLNGAYLSPFLRAHRAAVEEAWSLKARPFDAPHGIMRDLPDSVREPLGRVLGVPADEIGITTSTHYGAMLIAQGIRWREGDRVLLGPDEFPTNLYPWLALEERGVVVERIGTPGRSLAPADLAAALAHGGPVRALAIGAVHYVTGDVQPLAEFSALLRPSGAFLVVDGSQAVGAIDLDWRAIGADAVLMSGYKWLFGPFGIGAIWARPAFRDQLMDVNANWLALDCATDFDRVLSETPRTFEAHGRRFDMGESASHFNTLILRTGLEYLLEIGVGPLEAHYRAMQDAIVDAIAGLPLEVITRLDDVHRGRLLLLGARTRRSTLLDSGKDCATGTCTYRWSGRCACLSGAWSVPSDAAAFAAAAAELPVTGA